MQLGKYRIDLRTLGFGALGVLAFGGFLLVIGARLEPATIAMVITGAALAMLLLSLYRMVARLATPSSEALLDQEDVLVNASDRELREEKRRVLRAINELQFDHEMGKLSEEDYKAVRDLYELRAIEVMRALDADPDLHPKVAEDLAALEGGAKAARA